MIQTDRLAWELGALAPDQSIAKEIHEVAMEVLAYRFDAASVQEDQRLFQVCFAPFWLEIDANETQSIVNEFL